MTCTAALSEARSVSWSRPRDLRTRCLSRVVKMPTATFGASVGATGGLVTLTGLGLQVMGGAIQAYQGNIQPLVSAGYQAAATGLESLGPISKLLEQDAKGCRL